MTSLIEPLLCYVSLVRTCEELQESCFFHIIACLYPLGNLMHMVVHIGSSHLLPTWEKMGSLVCVCGGGVQKSTMLLCWVGSHTVFVSFGLVMGHAGQRVQCHCLEGQKFPSPGTCGWMPVAVRWCERCRLKAPWEIGGLGKEFCWGNWCSMETKGHGFGTGANAQYTQTCSKHKA